MYLAVKKRPQKDNKRSNLGGGIVPIRIGSSGTLFGLPTYNMAYKKKNHGSVAGHTTGRGTKVSTKAGPGVRRAYGGSVGGRDAVERHCFEFPVSMGCGVGAGAGAVAAAPPASWLGLPNAPFARRVIPGRESLCDCGDRRGRSRHRSHTRTRHKLFMTPRPVYQSTIAPRECPCWREFELGGRLAKSGGGAKQAWPFLGM